MPRGLLILLLLGPGPACRFDPSGLALTFDADLSVPVPDLPAADRDAADRDAPDRDAAPDLAEAGGEAGPDAAGDLPGPDGTVDPLAPFGPPTAVTALNSATDEDDPTLTGDMLEIYFNRDSDIWRSSRSSVTDPWSAPVQVPELCSASTETNPEITPDGLTLFLASDRGDLGSQGGYDIYISTRSQRGAPWSAPVPVASLNTSSSDHPAPAPDLLTMVLISDRPGSLGNHDLYLATRGSVSAAWGPATAITALNTATQESSAWLDATTLLLYHASSRQASNHDIWLSTRAATSQPFGPPVNLTSVNSPDTDEDPWLSPDLRTLYFSSTRNGSNDLFVAHR